MRNLVRVIFSKKVKKPGYPLETRHTRLAEINGQNIQNFNVVIYFGNVASNAFLKKNYADSRDHEEKCKESTNF